MLDKDKDGKLTLNEWQAGFDLFDSDRDGFISRTELSAVAQPGFVFESLDTDGDGKISRAEYSAAFAIVDADKDGFASRKEFDLASGSAFTMLDKDKDGNLPSNDCADDLDLFDSDRDGFIIRTKRSAVAQQGFGFESLATDGCCQRSLSEDRHS